MDFCVVPETERQRAHLSNAIVFSREGRSAEIPVGFQRLSGMKFFERHSASPILSRILPPIIEQPVGIGAEEASNRLLHG